MERVSTHISYKEATKSATAVRLGLKNEPDSRQLEAMKLIANRIFEPLRDYIREPIFISSFFRSVEVNRSVGGATASQHMAGEAMDIQAGASSPYTNADLFYYVKNYLDFDKLIWEFGDDRNPAWVHVSYRAVGNRKEILRAVKHNSKTVYEPFI